MEHACGMATLQMGEYVPNVSNGVDTYSLREPLGVCAGICPFNFPAMIPLWVTNSKNTFCISLVFFYVILFWLSIVCLLMQMFPIAVTCGNTFVLKPSEKDPGKLHTIHIT